MCSNAASVCAQAHKGAGFPAKRVPRYRFLTQRDGGLDAPIARNTSATRNSSGERLKDMAGS
jgi:hypothetical protein